MKRSLHVYMWPIFWIGLLGLLPLVVAPQLNDPVRYPQFLVLAAIVLAVSGLALLDKGGQSLGTVNLPRTVWILLVIWLGLHILSASLAINGREALFETLQSGLFVAVFLFGSHFFQTRASTLPDMSKVLIIGAGVQASLVLAQWAGLQFPPGAQVSPPSGTHANANQVAVALVLALPLLLRGGLRLSLGWKLAAGLSSSLALIALYLAGSRTSWLALLLWAAIAPFYLLPLFWRTPHLRKFFWAAVAFCLVGVVGVYFFSGLVNRKKEGSVHFEYLWEDNVQIERGHNSIEYRMILWNRSVDMLQEYALMGVGPGNWKVMIPKYGIKGFDHEGRYGLTYSIRPHNEFLQVGTELGGGGLLIFGAMLLGGLWWLILAIRKGKTEKGRTDAFLGMLGMVAILLVCTFSFPRERPFAGVMMALYLAWAVELRRQQREATFVAMPAVPLRWLLMGLAMLALVVGVGRTMTDGEIVKIRQAKAAQNWPLVQQLAEEAALTWVNLDPVSATPIPWFAGIAQLSTGQLAAGLNSMEHAAGISPHHLAVQTNLAAALELNGEHAAAAAAYRSLLETFPDFEDSWLNLAVVYLHLGDKEAAEKCLAHVSPTTQNPAYPAIQAELSRVNGR